MKSGLFLLIFIFAVEAFAKASVPGLFKILKNDRRQVVVELGDFAKFYDLTSPKYQVAVIHKEKKILVEDIESSLATLHFSIESSGIYEFYLYQVGEKIFWRQKVFAVTENEISLSDKKAHELAEAYAPVLSYHEDEPYYPTSLEYIFNLVDKDAALEKEPFILANLKPSRVLDKLPFFGSKALSLELSFKDLRTVLSQMGSADSVVKSGLLDFSMSRLRKRTGKKHMALNYAVLEDAEKEQIQIQYHFFYSYDNKTGSADGESWADHLFDRESMIVVLDRQSHEPLEVIYESHLENQKVAQLDRDGKTVQSWSEGRVSIPWEEAPKNAGRPAAFVALGSHAVYPARGQYAVLYAGAKALVETAGGLRVLVPESLPNGVHVHLMGGTRAEYRLLPLHIDRLTSVGADIRNILSYSGSMVNTLGPTNALFPPFAENSRKAFKFDMKKAYQVGY